MCSKTTKSGFSLNIVQPTRSNNQGILRIFPYLFFRIPDVFFRNKLTSTRIRNDEYIKAIKIR